MAVRPIPEGYHTLTPYLVAEGADNLIKFLEQAFGATLRGCHRRRDGTVMHAEMKVGDSIVMLSDANEQWKPRPASFYVYVEDTDGTYQRALDSGAQSLMAPANQFYGDRTAGLSDSFGNFWWIATHVEDVSKEELQRRSSLAA